MVGRVVHPPFSRSSFELAFIVFLAFAALSLACSSAPQLSSASGTGTLQTHVDAQPAPSPGGSAISAQDAPLRGPAAPPSPSTGCRANGRGTSGEGVIVSNGHESPYVVTVPAGYDPAKPTPLVFAVHGRTRSHRTMSNGDAEGFQASVGSFAIVAYLKSVGVGWGPRSVAPFEALHDRLLSSFCIDTERVFAAGHSSGAHFALQLACTHSEHLRGIAAVAGGLEGPGCAGRTAALLVHGRRDAVVSISRGRQALERVLERNHCGERAEPMGIANCVRDQGCDAGLPVAWCDHDEPTYQDTNHGWPSFASAAIASFFESLGPLPLPSGVNLLSSIHTASDRWDANFASESIGHVERKDGTLCANVLEPGDNPWDAQLAQHDLTLKQGQRYRVDLRLRASEPTHVRLKVGVQVPPYGEVWVQRRAVGREPLRVMDEFTLVEPPVPGAMALAVQMAGPLVEEAPVRVCIEEAWLSPVQAR